MEYYDFPLCLSCGIALENKIEEDPENNIFLKVQYCPNCQQIFKKSIYK